jgi:hypothetical protein
MEALSGSMPAIAVPELPPDTPEHLLDLSSRK